MSLQALDYVLENSNQTGSHLAVLLVIAHHANDHGDGELTAWPAIEDLACKVNMTPRHVKRILKDLEDAGELKINRAVGRGNASTYTIIKGDIYVTFCAEEKVTSGALKGDIPGKKVTSGALKGDTCVTPTKRNLNNNLKELKGGEKKPKPKRPPAIPAVAIHREILEAFVLTRGQQNELAARFEKEALNEGVWRRVLQVWKMRGYNPRNLEGQLDWYDQGGPPKRKDNKNGNGTHQQQADPVRPVVNIYTGESGLYDEAKGEWVGEPMH